MAKKEKPEIVQHPKMKCLLCKKKINPKDNFLILTEFNEGEEFSRAWYHVMCFRERFISIDKEKKQAQNIMSQAQEMFARIGI